MWQTSRPYQSDLSLTNHPAPNAVLPSNTIYYGSVKTFKVMTGLHVEVKLFRDTASVMALFDPGPSSP